MSHEGIRFLSKEDQERIEREEKRAKALTKQALTPSKVRVLKTEGTGMEIDWEDGHRSQWNFAWLRNACPCATCVEERQIQKREPGQPSQRPRNCFRCMRRLRGLRAPMPWDDMRSSSTGSMGTQAGSIAGISCGETVSARNAGLFDEEAPSG